MNAFEKRLKKKIENECPNLKEITPGLIVDVHVRGRRRGLLPVGQTYEYYDLASLTKILFTASSCIHYFSEHPTELKLPIKGHLPWWRSTRTTPFSLLTHSAGLDWWLPYYKRLRGPLDPQSRWNQLKKQLARSKPGRAGVKAIYSDLDMWTLGAFLESATQRSLLELWESVADRLDIEDMFFHPGNRPKFARSLYAPTEDCKWRRKILRGEVHDENTWALGGVAPHAGLFGTIEAVSEWGLELREAVLKDSPRFGDPKMVRKFVKRQIPRTMGDWGLGFMKPSRPRSSCGRRFSVQSFGHTGFTGTSYWFDPVKDLQVVILSNRVHPTRENSQFVQLRPRLHDWICELLSV